MQINGEGMPNGPTTLTYLLVFVIAYLGYDAAMHP